MLTYQSLTKITVSDLVDDFSSNVKKLLVEIEKINNAKLDEVTKTHQVMKIIRKWFMRGGRI